jgi:short-subunit dehydrogenase
MRALVLGISGGIGRECASALESTGYNVTGMTSEDIDLNNTSQIFDLNLDYDIVMNCTGHSIGTYQGFIDNDWRNQLSQINVNYVANIFLLKHYASTRCKGKYVWVSSNLISTTDSKFCTYASTKTASKTAIDLARSSIPHISILEVQVGLTRTNFRYKNYNGTKSVEEIDKMYYNDNALCPRHVALQIVEAIADGRHIVVCK